MSPGRKTLNLSECRVVGSSAGRGRPAQPPGAAQRGYIPDIYIFNSKRKNVPQMSDIDLYGFENFCRSEFKRKTTGR